MTINLWFLLSGSLLYILLISLLLIRRRFTVVTVSGYSMYPILQNGDRLLVLRYRSFRKYQTRQIVVIHPPYDNFRQEKLYVKWLTGLPGDQVTIPSSRLNRQIHSIQTNECNEQGSITWRIPEGHCFVKGESQNCPPCIEKIPMLNDLGPKAKRVGVELVLVNMGDKLKAETFVKEYDVRLPMLIAPENGNSFKEDYKVAGTPFFCLIDKESKVQATGYFGPDWYAFTQKWMAA